MNELGLISSQAAYSYYSIGSVFGSEVTPVKDKQADSVAKISNDNSAVGEINDTSNISDEAKKLFATEKSDNQEKPTDDSQTETMGQIAKAEELPAEKETEESPEAENTEKPKEQTQELSQEEKQQIAELKARDIEVKAHEQAHMAAAAGINASAPSYDYQVGPDGKKYAVGGEVSISFSKSSNPADNLKKAQTMKAAALAPANPSAQDMSVARSADQMIIEAQKEIVTERQQTSEAPQPTTPETSEVNSQDQNAVQTQPENPLKKSQEQPQMLDNIALTGLIYTK